MSRGKFRGSDLVIVTPAVLVLWVLPLISARLTEQAWQLYLGDPRLEPVPTPEWLFWFGLLLAGVAAGATLLRRRYPIACFVVSAVATLLASVLWLTYDIGVLAGLCFAEVARCYGRRSLSRWAVVGCLAALVLSIAQLFIPPEAPYRFTSWTVRWGDVYLHSSFDLLLLGVLVLVASWELGFRSRQQSDQAAREAELGERLRIRREIHDVLSHSLSTIGVRAGVAVQVKGQSEEALLALLSEIEHDSREGLRQLREILDQDNYTQEHTLRAALEQAMDRVRAAGLTVALEDDDELADHRLPSAIALTAQRLIQESLTNAVRHAQARSCRIALMRQPEGLMVQVVDDGHGVTELVPGHGLDGMRERVEQCGGSVTFGNVASGTGFQVSAHLPVRWQ